MDGIDYNNELNAIKFIALRKGIQPRQRKIKNKAQQNNITLNGNTQAKKKTHHINILHDKRHKIA